MMAQVDRSLGAAVVVSVPARVYPRVADALYRCGADLVLVGREYSLTHGGGDWARARRVAEVLEDLRKARKAPGARKARKAR